MSKSQSKSLRSTIIAAICLALCMVLPFLTGQIPQVGNALCPMHIPVLLCGFLCGPYYAAIVGIISPLLRFLIFGMPPIMPIGMAMCFELAAYGLLSGMLYRGLSKNVVNIYVSLITAMILGRVVWGIAMVLLSVTAGSVFTWELFLAGAFLNAIPGIIVHIILIPALVLALRRTGFLSAGNVKAA